MNWKRRERDLDAELRAHLEMSANDARARGESADAAHLAALREFGNRDLVKETTRDIWGRNPFHGIGSDIRAGLRTFRKNPSFASIVVLTLALGIGANTAIFSLVDAVMLRSLPVSHPEQLVQVTMGPGDDELTNPIWEQLRDRQDVFSGLLAYNAPRFNLAQGGEAHYVRGSWVSGQYFSTLGVQPAAGRTLVAADDVRGCAATAVLGYDFWQRQYGGAPAALNQAISLDGHPFQILGVAARGFTGIDVGSSVDVFVPICAEPVMHGAAASQLDQRLSWWLKVVARPKAGVDSQRATARLKILAPAVFAATIPSSLPPDRQRDYAAGTFEIKPAAGGISDLRVQVQQSLKILMAVVCLLLLIACANVANLLLARAANRQKEIAVRMAVGAGRWRLVRQLLVESALLAAAGAALGIVFAQWGSRLLVGLLSSAGQPVFLDLTMDARVLAFTVGVSALAAILFGLAPAWRATRVEPQAAMKVNGRGVAEGQSRFGLGKALVSAQVAVSLVLVVGAALMLTTFWNLLALNPGFERDRVLIVRTDLRNARFPVSRLEQSFEEMRQRLAAIPGVRSASFSNQTPVNTAGQNAMIQVDGFHPKLRRDSLVMLNFTSPGFFATLGTPLLAGRDFDARDAAGSGRVAVINETAARKYFGSLDVLGRSFRMGFPSPNQLVQVVGLVKDAKYRSLREDPRPIAYLPSAQDADIHPFINFELRAAGPAGNLAPAAKEAIAQVNPQISLEFRTLEAQVAESLTRERLMATLSGFFGGLALLLATVGLYGVISHNMARRRNEIGIRMALGAARSRVLLMALADVAVVVGLGLAAGLGASLAVTKYVASFLYGVTATDARTLISALLLFAAVAAIAGYLPARRASLVDPMVALREE
ncbi:MAG: ABC transporter permease [Bryobacteraceae bacterium]|jgi:predicted permease